MKLLCQAEVPLHCPPPSGDKTSNDQQPCLPEGMFEWRFNDRPIRQLSHNGDTFRTRHSERSALPQPGRGNQQQVYASSGGQTKRMEYRSELELPRHFVEQSRNVGRFECSSLFGAGVAEMEAPKIWSAAPTHVKAELVQPGSGGGMRPAAKITWPVISNGVRDERRGIQTEVSERSSVDGNQKLNKRCATLMFWWHLNKWESLWLVSPIMNGTRSLRQISLSLSLSSATEHGNIRERGVI